MKKHVLAIGAITVTTLLAGCDFGDLIGQHQTDKQSENSNTQTEQASNNKNSNIGNGQPSGKRSSTSNRFQRQWSSISQRRQGRTVTTSDLICWAFQCSRGMDYLTMRKVCNDYCLFVIKRFN